ncbi:HNH endonuclease [Brevibacillus sp. AG]|nr:HNH endonuclease [Brevibacillus sp. AG]MDC0763509.1 HNH endonuclease [Brevibacillus sp. AG]
MKAVLQDQLPKECQNCGSVEYLDIHHIVPLANGGTNRLTNLCTLCAECHGKVHQSDFVRRKHLQKLGIQRAKAEGKFQGRPTTLTKDSVAVKSALYFVQNRHANGLSMETIAKSCGMSRKTLYNKLKENGIKL